MFFFEKEVCCNCNKIHYKRKLIKYANKYFCSEDCFLSFMSNITIDEIIRLDKIDRQINKT